jgi:hypothetical protein
MNFDANTIINVDVNFIGNSSKATVDNWLVWARKEQVHPKVIEFIEANPNDLMPEDGTTNPRQWAKMSNLMNSCFFDGVSGNVNAFYNSLLGADRNARFQAFTPNGS